MRPGRRSWRRIAAGCDKSAVANAYGISVIHTPVDRSGAMSVAVLAPDGVSRVSFTDSDGVTDTVLVSDNVAAVEDQSGSTVTVRYTLPDGRTESATFSRP